MTGDKQKKFSESAFAKGIVESVLQSLFRDGHVSPEDLTPERLKKIVHKISSGKIKIDGVIIDHTNNLLEKARRDILNSDCETAYLFYATYFEHTLNRLIRTAASKKRISETHIKSMIKAISLNDKLNWALSLLDLPALDGNICNIVRRVAEKRNAFVHYKWNPAPDDLVPSRAEVGLDGKEIERAVRYLIRYEARIFYRGKKGIIKKLAQRGFKKSS